MSSLSHTEREKEVAGVLEKSERAAACGAEAQRRASQKDASDQLKVTLDGVKERRRGGEEATRARDCQRRPRDSDSSSSSSSSSDERASDSAGSKVGERDKSKKI